LLSNELTLTRFCSAAFRIVAILPGDDARRATRARLERVAPGAERIAPAASLAVTGTFV
jgi:hypothetical protein